MLISIIIPTLNEETYIGQLLGYLNNHPQKDSIEIIVVDGGSQDKTLSIAGLHEGTLIETKIASRAHQMNEGAKQANGTILYFVHADTQLVDSFVQDIHVAHQNGFKSGCYRFKFHQPQNPLLHINGFFTRFPFKWCRGGDQTLFIDKGVFESIDGFDEKYVIMEDYDILDRIDAHQIPFKVIPKSVKVSSRKYDDNSYMKVQLTNLKAMKMYKHGTDPSEIRKFYCQSLDGKYKEDHLFLGNLKPHE
ncbi:TIGR04283 family arsenosugar biosynthesis glycosyltransferase [Ekhidna sp.]|uniref:TIGR04283 family arsenosugar biosynthesis glycosyltransferase n=1 Tax=Ekhidna sp. TaxID=2608089 RepID=UPI003B5096CA